MEGYEARDIGGSNPGLMNDDHQRKLWESWGSSIGKLVPKSRHDDMDYRRKALAMVMENTFRQAAQDGSREGTRGLTPKMLMESNPSTLTPNVSDYANTIFPVLMKVFTNLIAHELVSVQPMSGPQGLIFYFDYKHSTTKGKTQAGTNLVDSLDPNYTSQLVDEEPLAIGNGVLLGGAGAALNTTLKFNPIMPYAPNLADIRVYIRELDVNGDVVQEARDKGDGTFQFVPTGGSVAGNIDYTTGALAGFKFQNAPADQNRVVATYSYNMEANTNIPRITMDIQQVPIQAQSRKLSASWSVEAADDLKMLHGIAGEAQLLLGVANEIGLEIDREILTDLKLGAQTTATWDRNYTGQGISELDHLRSILTVLHSTGAQIHQKTKRGAANWIVTSPEVASLLAQFQSHSDYAMIAPVSERDPSYGPTNSDFGVSRMGMVNQRWQVYQDPYFERDVILMGLKGNSYYDAGYVYAPYIPISFTPTFQDPNDQQYKKGMRTRYAKKMLRGEYYATVKVVNL